MTWFLLVYDRAKRQILELDRYAADATEAALAARSSKILHYIRSPQIEVALLGAHTEADLRITHNRYFDPAPVG
jgi:hypothetical protein